MTDRPRIFPLFALILVAAMAWANHRGYMVSSLFNPEDPALRSGSGPNSHK